MAWLDEDQVWANFDRRTEDGTVVFSKDYRTVAFSENGFEFEFRILSGFAKKPVVPGEQAPPPTSGCRPGSDIDVGGYEVAEVGPAHLLAYNKFAAARPHLLLLTQDGFRRQHERLDRADFAALRHALSALRRRARYLAIFNCGAAAGCSRLHKHLQLFPAPPAPEFELWPDRHDPDAWPALPFRCFVHRFADDELPPADALAAIYGSLLSRAEAAARSSGHDRPDGEADGPVPHNVVLDRKWMLVVPRRCAGWDGIVVNAAAMLGMVWVPSDEMLERWMEIGPEKLLAHVGVPANH
ncbi:hypothetical protein VTH06DRAFT_5288 [Thermothelomyces fergusii]